MATTADPTVRTVDALDRLNDFTLPRASVGMTYLYLVGHCGYIIFAAVAWWNVSNRSHLFRRVLGTRGTVIVPNSTHVLLIGTIVFSVVDFVFFAMSLVWQRDCASSRHWQIIYGCRYVPILIVLSYLLAATMSIWPFEAQKMRLPWLWNTCLATVPLSLAGSFMWKISQADHRYSAAWDLHEELKMSTASSDPTLTRQQAKIFVNILGLYRRAAEASMAWAYVGATWFLLIAIILFIVGVHTIGKISKEYQKTRGQVRRNAMTVRPTTSFDLLRGALLHPAAEPNSPLTASPALREHAPDYADDELYEQLEADVSQQTGPFRDHMEPKSHAIVFAPPPLPPPVDPALERQQKHLEVLAQLRSLLIHSAIQLVCIWGLVLSILAVFGLILLNLDAIVHSEDPTLSSSILSAIFQPLAIEQVMFLVLGNIYLISVMTRVRQAAQRPTELIFPRDDDPSTKLIFQVGPFLTPAAVPDCPQREEPAPPSPPVFCFTPRMVNVDVIKPREPAATNERQATFPRRIARSARSFETLKMLRRSGSLRRLAALDLGFKNASTSAVVPANGEGSSLDVSGPHHPQPVPQQSRARALSDSPPPAQRQMSCPPPARTAAKESWVARLRPSSSMRRLQQSRV
ncbi:hypothetical protein OC842_005625 [Tilletia horrida]|uniref:Uncharacterized protein n=1 Tax=Tilletia horrida TaxID=155126 RepID=A0AAN6GBX2_9BASI|nr:hypothetical protein OC842_005625 [Tilletia horrida]